MRQLKKEDYSHMLKTKLMRLCIAEETVMTESITVMTDSRNVSSFLLTPETVVSTSLHGT